MTGTVTLDIAAPDGGAVVQLASSNDDARPPASVTVAAGSMTSTFAIPTATVTNATDVTVTASYNDQIKSAQIRLTRLAP